MNAPQDSNSDWLLRLRVSSLGKFRALAILTLGTAASISAASPWQIIKIDGHDYVSVANIAKFYGFAKIDNQDAGPGQTNKKVKIDNGHDELEFTLASREMMINNVRNWLCFPVVANDGKFLVSRLDLAKTIEPQLRPHLIPNINKVKTVVLDPGHGGYDKGATSRYGCEKDYALDVARQLRPLLQAKALRVLLTREGDYFVPLEVRARIANAVKDSIFVSIHFNATDQDPTAAGLEIYSLTPLGAPSTHDEWLKATAMNDQNGSAVDTHSIELSACIYHSVLGHIAEADRGIKRARFAVLRLTKGPAVLVEGGFMTEKGESQLIANKEWRGRLALALSMGIENYRSLADHKQKPLLVRDYTRKKEPELFSADVTLQPAQTPTPTMSF
ncbi:MAG: N-acetylmuramoyl-L-alanine amidase [Spartobacteria bacterium]